MKLINQIFYLLMGLIVLIFIVGLILKTAFWLSDKVNKND